MFQIESNQVRIAWSFLLIVHPIIMEVYQTIKFKIQPFSYKFVFAVAPNSSQQRILPCDAISNADSYIYYQVQMGNNESSDWQGQFQITQSQNSIRKAVHKQAKQRYQILSLFPGNEEDLDNMLNRVKMRTAKSSPFLVPIHSYWNNNDFSPCGGKPKLDLAFRAGTPLEEYLTHRRVKNQRFSKDEIQYIVTRIAKGLNDVKEIKEEYGGVNFGNVVIEEKEVKLKDPFIVREQEAVFKKYKKFQGFPSPQKLYTYFDSLSTFEQHTSDLFSLGIMALQLIYPQQNLSLLYKNTNSKYLNCSIDMNELKAYVNGVTEEPLRSFVLVLTDEHPNKRREIYRLIDRRSINPLSLKVLSQNPYQIVDEQTIVPPKPEKIEHANVFSPPEYGNIYQTTRQQTNGKVVLPPFVTLRQSQAISAPFRTNESLINFKTSNPPAFQIWKPSKFLQSSYRIPSEQSRDFTPINRIVGTQNTSFKSPKFQMPPLPKMPEFPSLASILANNVTRSQMRMEKVSPKYIDSTYRNLFSKHNNPENVEKRLELPQQVIKIEAQTIVNSVQEKKQPLQPSFLVGKSAQTAEQNVKTSIEDIQSQKRSIIDNITNEVSASLNASQPTITQMETNQAISNPKVDKKDDKDGFVVEEYDIGTRYEGFKKNGMRNGQGQFIYKEGSKYRGEWKDNKMEGYGTLYYPNGAIAYEGQWHDDQFDGIGTVYNDHPTLIKGGFDYTNFNLLDEEWIKYEGQLKKDAKEGKGKLYLTNGETYNGMFEADLVHGEGTFTKINGSTIKGQWQEGLLKRIINE